MKDYNSVLSTIARTQKAFSHDTLWLVKVLEFLDHLSLDKIGFDSLLMDKQAVLECHLAQARNLVRILLDQSPRPLDIE